MILVLERMVFRERDYCAPVFTACSSSSQISEAVPILKRLLREVFADLITIKQKIEDLTPKDNEDFLFVPYEGSSTKPYPKAFADGLQYRSKAQLSGSLEHTVLLPIAPSVRDEATLRHDASVWFWAGAWLARSCGQ